MEHKTRTKALSWLLSFVMVLGMLPAMAVTASAQLEPVSYKAATVDPTTHAVTFSEMESEEYTVITDSSEAVAWDAGWYVVKGADVKISGAITANGNINLILCDGAKLTAEKGINVSSGYSLTIYGQSEGTGTLDVTNDEDEWSTNAISTSGGALTINGGTVITKSTEGNSISTVDGKLTINGGSVTASATSEYGSSCYAIVSNAADTVINGGTVSATATSDNSYSRGIVANNGYTLYIYGGNVTASALQEGCGLDGKDVTISGGNVTVSGGSQAINLSYFDWYHGSVTVGSGLLVMAGDSEATAVDATEAFHVKSTQHTEKWVQIIPTIPYQEAAWNSETHEVEYTAKSVASYTEVTASDTAWGTAGNETWYVVNSTFENSKRITVNGTVNLILCDGAKLTASKGITVLNGKTLNIYAQSDGESKGELFATGDNDSNNRKYAAIGGCNMEQSGGTVNIHGGTVTANGVLYGAGIGGANYGSGGNVTIYGGTVTATGGSSAAGIGAGNNFNDPLKAGTVTIYGGTVNATGGGSAAGIGGGNKTAGGDVYIYGGAVTATGGNYGAGIGKGKGANDNGSLTLGDGMYLYKDSVSDDNAVKKNDDGDYERSQKMIVNNVSPHAHNLTYTYTDTAVTAVCDGDKSDFCEFPLVDGKHTATLTITAPEKGGDPATADISGAAAFDETKISAITYETKQSDGTFAASAATPPEADGFHRASLTYTDGKGAHVISVTYGLNCITYGEAVNGTIDGVKSAAVGATITPTITPSAAWYELDTLTVTKKGDNSVEENVTDNKSFVMPDYDVTVSATFKLKQFNIISGLEAGATMTAKVNDATVTTAAKDANVVLTITPDAGYTVNTVSVKDSAEGSVDVSGENGSYSFTMPASDVTVTATYNAIDYNVSVSGSIAHGTVMPSKTSGAHVGETITLTITPNDGYSTGSVSVKDSSNADVTVSGTGNTRTFTMPADDVTVTATFTAIDYTVTVGTVTGGTVGTDMATAHVGDEITMTPTPGSGYQAPVTYTVMYTGEETAVTVTDNKFTMPAHDVTVTAAFTPTDYTVTVTQPDVGGTIGADKTTANIGNEITLTITPSTGYQLDALTVKDANNQDVTVTDNKFTMPASAVTVSATFTAIDYSVTIAESTNGTVTTATTGAVHIGDKITLTVTPAENYGVKTVTASSGTIVQTALNPDTGVATYELTMGAGNATVTATFTELTTYTVFYNASNAPSAVSVKLAGGEQSYSMTNNAKFGDLNCWSTQIKAGAGVGSLSLSVQEGSGAWTPLTISVVESIPNSLTAGTAVALAGESNAFVVAFIWGENTAAQSRYYLVTSNTTSISVPNPADTASETFSGWTYLVPAAEQGKDAEIVTVSKAVSGNFTTVQLDKIKQTTIVNAIWTPKSYTVSFNPDNGGATASETVTYGNKVNQPANPTKDGYEFVGWVLAKSAVEQVGDKTLQLSAGTTFGFTNTGIINNLELKAKWRHVHSYVCLPLDHSAFGGAFEEFYGYKGQLHVRICTSMDDYTAEAHSFVNGKCACGASILDDKVTLTQYAGSTEKAIKAIRNSFVSISAPQKSGSQTFSKWQYSFNATTKDDGSWADLTSARSIAFAIPNNMSTRAVYENETAKLSIRSFKYDNSHVAFQFDYSVPEGYTVVDGGLMWGDNVRMKFWDCTIKSFLGSQYEPSLRDAVSVFGGGTIASKMYNYQTINESGLATPLEKPLKSFGRTGTVAVAWQPYTSAAYSKALNTKTTIKGYNQNKYPTYAMGYIICKHNGAYVGFMTNAISATLERPSASHVAQISVSG